MHVLYLIRHGETAHNRDGLIQGHTESDLSDLGREQARRVGERIRDVPIVAAYTSSLRRAVDTCRIAMEGRVTFEERDGLKEIHLGAWEGKKASDLRVQFPREVKQWFVEPSQIRIDQAETIRAFRSRVSREIDGIRAGHPDETIAVFAHGGVICTYLTRILRMRLDDIWRFKIRNGSITRVIFPQGRPRVDLLGDIHHLNGALREMPKSSFRMFP